MCQARNSEISAKFAYFFAVASVLLDSIGSTNQLLWSNSEHSEVIVK